MPKKIRPFLRNTQPRKAAFKFAERVEVVIGDHYKNRLEEIYRIGLRVGYYYGMMAERAKKKKK